MENSMLVKCFIKDEVDEVLMLVEKGKDPNEWLKIAGEVLLGGRLGVKLVFYEIVLDNIAAPMTFALDHYRPYAG